LRKPSVVVSKCLGLAACRYNGQVIPDRFVKELAAHVEFVPVCPEVEIGLGVPRNPVRLLSSAGKLRLVQPATGRDVTEAMGRFAEQFLASLGEVDGAVLKGRSPSCGIKDVKVYPAAARVGSTARGAGLFGGAVVARFPGLPVEDEGRLRNFKIREHFLTRLFALASFREVSSSGSMGRLVRFHTENKYLLMAHNQKELKLLGRIVANPEKRGFGQVSADYEGHLKQALAQAPGCTRAINVLMHALGHLSEELTAKEKAFFLDALQRYRNKRIPLSAAVSILKAWLVSRESPLGEQTFFEPYPEGLVRLTDSGKEEACAP
jgi:uncharacterized protein YbgA (DUF1722 family)/uncharacterized protein YbbK (DUF523 family)